MDSAMAGLTGVMMSVAPSTGNSATPTLSGDIIIVGGICLPRRVLLLGFRKSLGRLLNETLGQTPFLALRDRFSPDV